MPSLLVTSLFSSASGSVSGRGRLAANVVSRDAEDVEVSSYVVGPLSRECAEPAISQLSGHESEETREAEYLWVNEKVREEFSEFTKVSLLQDFVENVDIVLEGVPSGAFALRRCRAFETVCLGRGRERKDFFYFYS